MELPIVNTAAYKSLRRRYECSSGGTFGLNVVFFNGLPHLVVFISDTDQYEDQFDGSSSTLFYEFQDQIRNTDGSMKKNPMPLSQHGPKLRNKLVLDTLGYNGGTLPVITIQKQSTNRWAELYTDCVCRGISVASDGSHYFRIERSRVPWWFLGPVKDNDDEKFVSM